MGQADAMLWLLPTPLAPLALTARGGVQHLVARLALANGAERARRSGNRDRVHVLAALLAEGALLVVLVHVDELDRHVVGGALGDHHPPLLLDEHDAPGIRDRSEDADDVALDVQQHDVVALVVRDGDDG